MSDAKQTPTPLAALPLHFDGDTNNLINSEGVTLARFRHFSQGVEVARRCNVHDALVTQAEQRDEAVTEACARLAGLEKQRDALAAALEECANRFERCCIHSGSDKEFAAHAVEDYRALIKSARGAS
jgi:hypothetical protein